MKARLLHRLKTGFAQSLKQPPKQYQHLKKKHAINIVKRIFHLAQLSLCCALIACSQYEVSLNTQTLYSPPRLLSDYKVEDIDLAQCLKFAVRDQEIYKYEDLQTLLCGPGNISNLSGLSQFSELSTLGLQANKLKHIGELASLTNLQHLNLAGNHISNASDLSALDKLVTLDLSGNQQLQCETAEALSQTAEVRLPKHCGESR